MICAAASLAWASPRVAVVYSDFGYGAFKREFDATLKNLGWNYNPETDKVLNTQLPELTKRLAEYDYVLVTSTGNYTNTVDMKPYASEWLEFLARGGNLLIVDANYDSVLDHWVATLGPTFICGAEHCSAHTNPSPANGEATVTPCSLLQIPEPLGDGWTTKYHHWAHLTNLAPAWQTPITCVDGHPLFVYQNYGKGMVVLTVASSLSINPILPQMLKNLEFERSSKENDIKVQWMRRGLNVTTATMQVEDSVLQATAVEIERGSRACVLKLTADPSHYKQLDATLTCKGTHNERMEMTSQADVAQDGTVLVKFIYAPFFRGKRVYELTLNGNGQKLFRVNWEDQEEPAIDIKLKRKHLYPGNKLHATLSFKPEKMKAEALNGAFWRLDDGTWTQLVNGATNQNLICNEADKLPVGKHTLSVRLDYADGFDAEMTEEDKARDWGQTVSVEFFKHDTARYMMRDDHVLLEDGKPFFPLGFYHVSWGFSTAERLEMARAVAACGYNTIHVGIKGEEAASDSYGQFLDECAKLNLRVITEFGCNSADVIRKYKDKPAVMGWNPGDEPAPKGIKPEEMFRRYDTFKQLDPEHIAYTVICVPSQYANYAAGTDVLAPDPYPVPSEGIETVYRHFSAAKAAANACDTALWSVGQAFGGQKYTGWKRCPTAQEFRGMSYLALMAGSKGFVYYVFQDDAFDIRNAPELWAAAQSFPSELKDTLPMVLDGTYKLLQEGKDGIYAACWSLNGDQRLVIVNVKQEPVTVTLTTSAKTVLYGDAAGVKVTDCKLTATLAPLERLVLK